MGDCHSFDPGSNPGPGVSFILYLKTDTSDVIFLNIASLLTAMNDKVLLGVRSESSIWPFIE